MIDLKQLRAASGEYKAALARKGYAGSQIDELLKLDERRRALQTDTETLKARQNEASKLIPTLAGDAKAKLLGEMKELSAERKAKGAELETVTAQWQSFLETVPNPPHPEAPDGASDEDNVVLRTWGEKPVFDFAPRDHAEVAAALGILDMERGAKVSGSRFYYLRNELAVMSRALMHWAFLQLVQRGYSATIPPFMTREPAIYGTGYLAKDENYVINPGEDDLYLIGTSEVPMVSYHSDEILEAGDLPLRYVSYSPCFRREAGSYGKDTSGIFRVHQFEKIEMVIFGQEADNAQLHQEILEIEEDLLQQLGIHYQVVDVCCGDLGVSAAKKYDLEAWLPGQGKYREMTSTSICTDWQARRIGARVRQADGSLTYAHILNGTAVSSRPLVAILENYQQADGSVIVPEVLRELCGFAEIRPKG